MQHGQREQFLQEQDRRLVDVATYNISLERRLSSSISFYPNKCRLHLYIPLGGFASSIKYYGER